MPVRLTIHIGTSGEETARAAAGHVVQTLSRAVAQRGKASLVLAGGETPRRVYQLLALPPLSNMLAWDRCHFYFGDERMVPPDHPDSNFGMARGELFGHLRIPEENVHRIRGEQPPEQAAREYADDLLALFSGSLPRFDCVMLGVGEDGHTASLFPGTDVLKEKRKNVSALFVPRLNTWRVTLTFPVINNAREILFLAGGARKASIVRKVIESAAPSSEIPATMVRPHDGDLQWFLDAEAASHIR
ncbi:MAG TPA: 6-phosphogluconolactonase [Bacteroidota bacterium]